MKEIRIFLASSYELEPDRARIGNLIRDLNDEYEKRDIHLCLVKWEDLDAFYNLQGKQDEYDERVRNCDIFIGLFWHVAGKYTVHEVEVAGEHVKPENLLLFKKTAKYKPDHEGSEDEKRFFELHPDAKDDEREAKAFLESREYRTYLNFNGLRKILIKKLKEYCAGVTVTEKDRKNKYSPNALQIHVIASEEAEPDLARLGDLVRYLDENSKQCCRVKLIRDIPRSDMFVSLCHTTAPMSMPKEIDTAIKCNGGKAGRPRLYFCLKYVPENTKEQSLIDLEKHLETVFRHYPDRYTQASELKLHFLMQLERLKNPSGSLALTVKGNTICQQLGEHKFPLLSCDEMTPLQEDPAYRALKEKRKCILDDIEKLDKEIAKLKEQKLPSAKALSKKAQRRQMLEKIEQQISDKRNGYFMLARTLEEQVGGEQDEEIADIRDLISRGMIDLALELLPNSETLGKEWKECCQRFQENGRQKYELCRVSIDCLAASDLRKNRDEIEKLFKLQIDIAEQLQDEEKKAKARHAYGFYLTLLGDFDRALELLEKALAIFRKTDDDPNTAECLDDIGDVWSGKGRLADRAPKPPPAAKDRSDAEARRDGDRGKRKKPSQTGDRRDHSNACRDNDEHRVDSNVRRNSGEYDAEHAAEKARLCHQKALECYEEALAIRKRLGGNENIAVAVSYSKISRVYLALGKIDESQKIRKSAEQIYQKASGKNSDIAGGCGDAPKARFGCNGQDLSTFWDDILIADKLEAVGDTRAEQYRATDSETWRSGESEEIIPARNRIPKTAPAGAKKKLAVKTVSDDGKDDKPGNTKNDPAEIRTEAKTKIKAGARRNAPLSVKADNAPDAAANDKADVKLNVKTDDLRCVGKNANPPENDAPGAAPNDKVNVRTDVGSCGGKNVNDDPAVDAPDDTPEDTPDAKINAHVSFKVDNTSDDTPDGKGNAPVNIEVDNTSDDTPDGKGNTAPDDPEGNNKE